MQRFKRKLPNWKPEWSPGSATFMYVRESAVCKKTRSGKRYASWLRKSTALRSVIRTRSMNEKRRRIVEPGGVMVGKFYLAIL